MNTHRSPAAAASIIIIITIYYYDYVRRRRRGIIYMRLIFTDPLPLPTRTHDTIYRPMTLTAVTNGRTCIRHRYGAACTTPELW